MSNIPKKAFPANGGQGMTLRDYFAAKAMQSLITAMHDDKDNYYRLKYAAELSFVMADAMLAAGGHNATDEQGKS